MSGSMVIFFLLDILGKVKISFYFIKIVFDWGIRLDVV